MIIEKISEYADGVIVCAIIPSLNGEYENMVFINEKSIIITLDETIPNGMENEIEKYIREYIEINKSTIF